MKFLSVIICGIVLNTALAQDSENYDELPPTEEELFYEGEQINPDVFQEQEREEEYTEEQGYYPLDSFPESQEENDLLNLGENPQEDTLD